MSVMRGFSQPVTKNFKVDGATTRMCYGDTPALAKELLLEQLDASQYVQVSTSLILFDNATNLTSAAADLAGSFVGNTTLTQYETLKDMGDQLYIGLQGDESALIVFRLVQRSNSQVGYVCVQNSFDTAALLVKVSRV